jgi:hypothetical protein
MIRAEPAEESRARALPGPQLQRLILDRHHRMFVLQSSHRQALHDANRLSAGASRQSMNLHRIRREAFAATQAADHAPGIATTGRKILA